LPACQVMFVAFCSAIIRCPLSFVLGHLSFVVLWASLAKDKGPMTKDK
jgi:hypothetical protein